MRLEELLGEWSLIEDNNVCMKCKKASKVKGEKYCKNCKKQVLADLKSSGYLQRGYYPRNYRSQDAKENTTETKFGRGH